MAAHSQPRSGSAVALAILLIGFGLAAAWWAIAPGILGFDSESVLDGALAPAVVAGPEDAALAEGVRLSSRLQTSQPRDPFEPLISEGSGSGGSGGGTAVEKTSFTLTDVSDVQGAAIAEVTVDGISYSVGVGDTFAGSFKVISLDIDAGTGVFSYGDNTFSVAIGQAILKQSGSVSDRGFLGCAHASVPDRR